jgi:hypothetical protein
MKPPKVRINTVAAGNKRESPNTECYGMQSQKKPDIFEDQVGDIKNTPSDTTANRTEQNSRVIYVYVTRDG